jgi:hypothetical protein
LAINDRIHLALLDKGPQSYHAGPIKVLRRFAAGYDQLSDLGSRHDGHGSDLRLLDFERNTVVGLIVCRNLVDMGAQRFPTLASAALPLRLLLGA